MPNGMLEDEDALPTEEEVIRTFGRPHYEGEGQQATEQDVARFLLGEEPAEYLEARRLVLRACRQLTLRALNSLEHAEPSLKHLGSAILEYEQACRRAGKQRGEV